MNLCKMERIYHCKGGYYEEDQKKCEFYEDNPSKGRCRFNLGGHGCTSEAARTSADDPRRPEHCKFFGNNYWDAMPLIAQPETELVRCKEGLKKMYCPCAAFVKKEVGR